MTSADAPEAFNRVNRIGTAREIVEGAVALLRQVFDDVLAANQGDSPHPDA